MLGLTCGSECGCCRLHCTVLGWVGGVPWIGLGCRCELGCHAMYCIGIDGRCWAELEYVWMLK